MDRQITSSLQKQDINWEPKRTADHRWPLQQPTASAVLCWITYLHYHKVISCTFGQNGYLKRREQSLHEYKSDLALVRKLQLHFKFSNVHALIWDSPNVTLCFMHIPTPLTWRTRSSAAASSSCAQPCGAELPAPMGSSVHPEPPPAASWQLTLALLHQRHRSPLNASRGTGQASPAQLEWSCLASASQGSRAGDYSDLFCLGLAWPSVMFRCQARGCWTLPMTSHSHILCECCFDLPCGNEARTTRAGSSKALHFA